MIWVVVALFVLAVGVGLWLQYVLHKEHIRQVHTLSELAKVDPTEFQYLTVRIMKAEGWTKAKVNDKLKADGGRDVVGSKDGEKRLGQCKRYAFNKTITVEAIREFSGVCKSVEYGPAKGLFVATCKFSEPARVFAENNNIELWDLKKIIEYLE